MFLFRWKRTEEIFKSKYDGAGTINSGVATIPDDGDDENFVIEELSFELYRQVGRVRNFGASTPSLGLPWTIVHPMNRHSPLRNATQESLTASGAEIIITFDGVSEALGVNVQSRWSYIPSEVVWNSQFVPIVTVSKRGTGFSIDYTKISNVIPVKEVKVATLHSET